MVARFDHALRDETGGEFKKESFEGRRTEGRGCKIKGTRSRERKRDSHKKAKLPRSGKWMEQILNDSRKNKTEPGGDRKRRRDKGIEEGGMRIKSPRI